MTADATPIHFPPTNNHSTLYWETDWAGIHQRLESLTAPHSKAFYLTDHQVHKALWSQTNFPDPGHIISAGEASKNWNTVETILQSMVESGLDRQSVVVAVGGGVVTDLGGLVANLFFRGISVILVPTSLLSMVDASIGGKTGVDLSSGKNLVGTIYQPSAILIGAPFLQTLPPAEWRHGAAEMIKHALVLDQSHQKALLKIPRKNYDPSLWWDSIKQSAQIKVQVVTSDPYEKGDRVKLNFGHTWGHALEQFSEYQIPHGQAIAWGMVQEVAWAVEKGKTPPAMLETVRDFIDHFDLPTENKSDWPTLTNAWGVVIRRDKKRHADAINLAILENVGTSHIEKVPWKELPEFFQE